MTRRLHYTGQPSIVIRINSNKKMCDRIVNGNFLSLANENVIDFLIKKGLDVNHRSKNGHTALHYAAMGSSKR